ncbi:MAG: ATP-dependent DNA helicase RecG [Patescibacteria group bacterium]
MTELNTLLEDVPSIGARFIKQIQKLGIETVRDLLWHFPTRYEDFSKIYNISDLIPNEEVTVRGVIKEVNSRRTWQRRLLMTEAFIDDETGTIRAVWFNQPYIRNTLQPGRLANFSGKVSSDENELYLSNPTYELFRDDSEETKHTARIVPIYPETRGLTSKGLRYLIKPVLDSIPKITETIPKETLASQGLPDINMALQEIHFPTSIEDAFMAKRRFAFEDLFFLQLHNLREKMRLQKEKAIPIKSEISGIKDLITRLPFELTVSQKKSLWEIVQDISKPNPMNRLLQGDVGSGKTIIAAIASIITAKNNCQSAFMAPTEILAQQHYQTFKNFFKDFELGVALLTASESKIFYGEGMETDLARAELLRHISSGKIRIVIGTHALIQKGVGFSNLALVVVDEQHRFGVEQRATLLKNKILPHFLSMSATPIPRTLSLTLFGDLDLSLITELPKNRKAIITSTVKTAERTKAYDFIRKEVKNGRQAFVICPRIEPPDPDIATNDLIAKLELKSVKEEYEKLSKKIFPNLRVDMLHGKMKAKEKGTAMKNFTERATDILVSTSVVEVGVDIPNATIMMIEGADRFGLAQLYQFRGRVGRGEHQSYCLLFTDSASQSTNQRLKSIVEAKNGFELAEHDLQIRGPGQFLGASQTGMPDLAMKAIQNPGFVKIAREAAEATLKTDPLLKKHPALLLGLNLFKKGVHLE